MSLIEGVGWLSWDQGSVLNLGQDVEKLPIPPVGGCHHVQISQSLSDASYGVILRWMKQHGVRGLRLYGDYGRRKFKLGFLEQFDFLEELSIELFEISSLPPIDVWAPGLRSVTVGQTRSRALDLACLTRLRQLSELYLESHKKFIQIADQLSQVERLTLRGISIRDADLFDNWDVLRTLKLDGGKPPPRELLCALDRVTNLEIGRLSGLDDIEWLPSLEGVESFQIYWQPKITKFPDLSSMTSLQFVAADTMNGLTDAAGLAKAPHIEDIRLISCPRLDPESLRGCVGHPRLRSVWVGTGTDRGNAAMDAVLGPLSTCRRADP